jgi:N6-adenosine-specific RNA methylase IME4
MGTGDAVRHEESERSAQARLALARGPRSGEVEPDDDKYRTILLDPPWDIEQKGARGAIRHYKLMDLDRIAALPVADLAAVDAHLYLWTTNATLRVGYDIAAGWGFTVRAPFHWLKPRLGLGQYMRHCSETLLFATRGRAPVQCRSQINWMIAPVQDHSHKPEEVYAVAERLSQPRRLEMFARRRRAGWDSWGDQVDSDLIIPGFPVPSDSLTRSAQPSCSPRNIRPANVAQSADGHRADSKTDDSSDDRRLSQTEASDG